MQVKRFQGLLMGLLMMFGVSSSAMGQDITAGITIRVDRPDSGAVAAIGDSIVVRVVNTLTTTARLRTALGGVHGRGVAFLVASWEMT